MTRPSVVITEVPGQLEAEIIRGLLASYEIPAELSQESAGIAIGLTVGRLGRVQVLVPPELEHLARQVLEAYQRGDLEAPDSGEDGDEDDDEDEIDA